MLCDLGHEKVVFEIVSIPIGVKFTRHDDTIDHEIFLRHRVCLLLLYYLRFPPYRLYNHKVRAYWSHFYNLMVIVISVRPY